MYDALGTIGTIEWCVLVMILEMLESSIGDCFCVSLVLGLLPTCACLRELNLQERCVMCVCVCAWCMHACMCVHTCCACMCGSGTVGIACVHL